MGPSTLICGADFIKDFQAKKGPLQVTNANYLILNIRHYCLSKSFHYYAWGFCISSINGQRSLAGLQSMGLQRVGHNWAMDFWYLLSPLSLSGLVFIGSSVSLSGLQFLLTQKDCTSRTLGKNKAINISFHGSWEFVQGLWFAYLGVFQSLRCTDAPLAAGSPPMFQGQGLGADPSLRPFKASAINSRTRLLIVKQVGCQAWQLSWVKL